MCQKKAKTREEKPCRCVSCLDTSNDCYLWSQSRSHISFRHEEHFRKLKVSNMTLSVKTGNQDSLPDKF